MRFASKVRIMAIVAAFSVAAVGQQKINPHTQINWPGQCQIYNVADNACVPVGIITFEGTWSSTVTYAINQAVFFDGSTYVSLQNGNLNHNPATSTAHWTLFASGGSIPPAGSPQDVMTNLNGIVFGADSGNFTYVTSTHTLNTINQVMSGTFNQSALDMPLSNQVENLSDGPSDSLGNGANGAGLFHASNWGVGKNVGNAEGFTTGSGWRTITTLQVNLDAYSSGIAQALHLVCNHYGSGDSACVYEGNGEGFSPSLWTDASGEGLVGININGTQYDCIASGTITSTTGTGDRNPVFSITPLNCNGGETLINDGIIIDTSITLLHTALTGTVSTVWESNPLQLGLLAVTPGTVTPSTGMCVIAGAEIPQSSVPGQYQTQNFGCTVHDSHPLTTGHVFIATAGGPEQCDVLTVSGSGTQTGTISCAKEHPVGGYIFQGGTQGFGDFDDDITVLGLHSVVYVFGAPDANDVIIGQRTAGGLEAFSLPYQGREPAGLTLTGGFTVHPGALCVSTNSNNSQCQLESNTIAWAATHGFASPVGLVSAEAMGIFTSTQSAPDNTQSSGAGLIVDFASNTQHSAGHPFLSLGNFAPLSRYLNSGTGAGYLTAPPAMAITGAISNVAQFDMVLAGDGSTPCGGGTLFCFINGLHLEPLIKLFADQEDNHQILIDGPNRQYHGVASPDRRCTDGHCARKFSRHGRIKPAHTQHPHRYKLPTERAGGVCFGWFLQG
jgi:hypothetical protein